MHQDLPTLLENWRAQDRVQDGAVSTVALAAVCDECSNVYFHPCPRATPQLATRLRVAAAPAMAQCSNRAVITWRLASATWQCGGCVATIASPSNAQVRARARLYNNRPLELENHRMDGIPSASWTEYRLGWNNNQSNGRNAKPWMSLCPVRLRARCASVQK